MANAGSIEHQIAKLLRNVQRRGEAARVKQQQQQAATAGAAGSSSAHRVQAEEAATGDEDEDEEEQAQWLQRLQLVSACTRFIRTWHLPPTSQGAGRKNEAFGDDERIVKGPSSAGDAAALPLLPSFERLSSPDPALPPRAQRENSPPCRRLRARRAADRAPTPVRLRPPHTFACWSPRACEERTGPLPSRRRAASTPCAALPAVPSIRRSHPARPPRPIARGTQPPLACACCRHRRGAALCPWPVTLVWPQARSRHPRRRIALLLPSRALLLHPHISLHRWRLLRVPPAANLANP